VKPQHAFIKTKVQSEYRTINAPNGAHLFQGKRLAILPVRQREALQGRIKRITRGGPYCQYSDTPKRVYRWRLRP
jgi:hypothetical protein